MIHFSEAKSVGLPTFFYFRNLVFLGDKLCKTTCWRLIDPLDRFKNKINTQEWDLNVDTDEEKQSL